VTETTAEEQIEIWKKELAIAMADGQWRRALQLCSWLRYTLRQQELSDPEVEEAHRQAKEGLAEQVIREKAQQEHEERHRRLRRQTMDQIIFGDWDQALDSIEALYQDGANRQEAIHLLQELKARLATLLSPKFRQVDQRAAALGRRFDELVERVRDGPQ
jgi:hypothetical protein